MLVRQDIESDLLRGAPEELRDAFDALVSWNAGSAIEGMPDAAGLMSLFERVCTALASDDGSVPPDTIRALLHGRGGASPDAVATYAGAARFALAARRTWWPAFAASFPDGD